MSSRLVIITNLIIILTTSCGQVFPSPAPTPLIIPTNTPISPPQFKGRLIVGYPDGMFALESDSATGKLKEIEIPAKWQDAVSVSPNQRYLISSDPTIGTQIVDLSTYGVTTLLKNPVDCLQWSPDSKRFSFRDLELSSIRIYDITLHAQQPSTVIYEPPSAVYGGATRYGDVGCAHWIGTDRLLFDRFVGNMPSSLTVPGEPEIAANRTTLAILGDTIKLLDSSEMLHLVDVSTDLSSIMVSKNDQLYVGESFYEFRNMNLRSLASLRFWDASSQSFATLEVWDSSGEFIPNSRNMILEDESRVLFVDGETLEVLHSFAKHPEWTFYRVGTGRWVGDPNEGIIAFGKGGYITIGDFRTRARKDIWRLDKYGGHLNWLVWLP